MGRDATIGGPKSVYKFRTTLRSRLDRKYRRFGREDPFHEAGWSGSRRQSDSTGDLTASAQSTSQECMENVTNHAVPQLRDTPRPVFQRQTEGKKPDAGLHAGVGAIVQCCIVIEPSIEPEETPVVRSSVRRTMSVPLAPARRPVPPVIVSVSVIVAIGSPTPSPTNVQNN